MPTPFDDELAAEAEALLGHDGAREVLLMGVALHPVEDTGGMTAFSGLEVMNQLEFSGEMIQRVFPVANGIVGLADRLVKKRTSRLTFTVWSMAGRRRRSRLPVRWPRAARHKSRRTSGNGCRRSVT